MKIYDMSGNLLDSPDYAAGRLVEDRIFVAHHEAVGATEERSHYKVITEYPNGGKDVQKVIDTPAVAAQAAWDEYEDIYRYVPYTAEELAAIETERSKPTTEERIADLEAALGMLLSGVTE